MRIHYQRVAPFNPRLFIFELFPYYNRKTQYDPLTASAVYPGRRLNALRVRQTRSYQRLMHQRTRFSIGDPNLEIRGLILCTLQSGRHCCYPRAARKWAPPEKSDYPNVALGAADIRGFFDNMSHEWTMKFVEHRVADRRILRLIQKWLKAGVSEDGQWSESKVGTPQGAVVSPILANVYLHYVFDLWIETWRQKVATGDVIVVRYADDLVAGFENRTEAERFLEAFRERLVKFGLESIRRKRD
jgi:hypothetical protein